MAYSTISVSSQPITPKTESPRTRNRPNILNQQISGQNLRQHAKIQRAYSSMNQPKLKNSRSPPGVFNLHRSSPFIPNSNKTDVGDVETEKEAMKQANWIEMLMEITIQWVQKQDDERDGENEKEKRCDEDGNGEGCEVDYSDDDEDNTVINQETFSGMLKNVSWPDTKLLSKLAFLCNMAYVIPEIEEDDLRRFYDLTFVTSSTERKALADENHAKEDDDIILDNMVADTTMTAEKEKQEAARDLQSLHSSPCEWFICDDSSTYTRCFVVQGLDSVESWEALLFFEPTKFEGTGVLVHKGIYEAAKGIYDQFMPHILEHMNRFGERAKLQFTGHSVGGSLSLLVNLMLLTRNVVKPSALRPVVTFGSPFVFCNGKKILDQLGLDENHVHCVMMHMDIMPRAFSCDYPNHVAQLLKRFCATFRSHPCLNRNRLLYTPLGKMFIIQPNENFSPHHPLLPPGSAIYILENTNLSSTKTALRAFLNSPHPIETLQHLSAYGSDGTILRNHDSSNYLMALNGIIRQHTKRIITKPREHKDLLWPLLTSQFPLY
ncbi:hypothetical protein SSX86_004705 [Deinandra increscens subsp. villosa]|uniref:Fungal lipase-type domain-containing protein n=1 Tax=Deinandra increscens subsp. villosa TaxID=3103831 RepID=A0AAP0DKJ3_9ASTR